MDGGFETAGSTRLRTRTLSTEGPTGLALRSAQTHAGLVMTLAHAYALAEARSRLAALADTAVTFDASVAYEHTLLYLDAVHRDEGPGIDYPDETDPERLLARTEAAIESLVDHGVDALTVELLLVVLADAREMDVHGGAESAPPG